MRYVLDLKRNLSSLGVFDKEGCSFKSQGGVLRVSRGLLLYMKGALKGGLYVWHGKTLVGEAIVTTDQERLSVNLLNQRLGHIRKKDLYELSKQGL